MLTLRCSPHTGVGQPWCHTSNKQQTPEGFMFSARGAARAPGLLRAQRGSWGPWAQPGCDDAVPQGRLQGCPGKGSAGALRPQGLVAHSLPSTCVLAPAHLPAWAGPRDSFLLREPLGAAGTERCPGNASDQGSPSSCRAVSRHPAWHPLSGAPRPFSPGCGWMFETFLTIFKMCGLGRTKRKNTHIDVSRAGPPSTCQPGLRSRN